MYIYIYTWCIHTFSEKYSHHPEGIHGQMQRGRYFQDNLPADLVPPADFDAPESASENGKDSSSTAIVASALLELYAETGASN